MVEIIKDAISQGLTQKQACKIFRLTPRKFRRWANPKPLVPRSAWNRILPEERESIIQTASDEKFWDKPLSHIFVHGHESGKFFASLSTVYNVLKSDHLVRQIKRRKSNGSYVSAHSLLKEGFSLLCYDATRFVTESGVPVWAIPVMVLPYRYLLHVGHSLNGVSSSDLVRTVSEALARLPDSLELNLIAHSDRGSEMKASYTRISVKDLLGAPIHYGRPHTPDDQSWIEAFAKTLKYHREVPLSFKTVADIVQWLTRFPELYNNDPHSSLKYVTPLQAISGQQEVILSQRKQNLLSARKQRYASWQKSRVAVCEQAAAPASEVVMLPT
ncbi:MAG: integrase core domain-containing protein [Elusimicrobiota bacterium]